MKNEKKTLKEEYSDIGELKREADKQGYFMMSIPGSPYIRVELPEEAHEIRGEHYISYKIEEDGSLTRFHMEDRQKEIAKELAKHVDAEKLMVHILSPYNPEELEELFERVIKKEGKVTEQPGCYSLNIGGKRGRPMNVVVSM